MLIVYGRFGRKEGGGRLEESNTFLARRTKESAECSLLHRDGQDTASFARPRKVAATAKLSNGMNRRTARFTASKDLVGL